MLTVRLPLLLQTSISSKRDVVQWRYTKNLGEDLGEDNSKWGPLPGSQATGTGSEIKVTSSGDCIHNRQVTG